MTGVRKASPDAQSLRRIAAAMESVEYGTMEIEIKHGRVLEIKVFRARREVRGGRLLLILERDLGAVVST